MVSGLLDPISASTPKRIKFSTMILIIPWTNHPWGIANCNGWFILSLLDGWLVMPLSDLYPGVETIGCKYKNTLNQNIQSESIPSLIMYKLHHPTFTKKRPSNICQQDETGALSSGKESTHLLPWGSLASSPPAPEPIQKREGMESQDDQETG